MSILCKHCGSKNHRKDGFMKGNQRYRCKDCNKTFCLGDKRERYEFAKKLRALKMYTEGMAIRSIARIEGVSAPLLLHWIRNIGKALKQKLVNTSIPDDAKEIQILEVDELFTYYQKPIFG